MKPCLLLWTIALLLGAGCVQGAKSPARHPLFVTFEKGDRTICCGVALLAGGGIVVVGRADAVDGRSWAWAAKVSSGGLIDWEREWQPLSGLYAASEIAGDAVIAVGHTGSGLAPTIGLIVNIEPSGGIAWTRTLQLGDATRVGGVVADGADGAVIAGMFRTRSEPFLFVARVTGHGEIRDQTTVGPGDYLHAFHAVGRDGYVMVTGEGDVIRLDRSGRLRWRQKVRNVSSVTGLNDGEVLVAHSSYDRSFEGTRLIRFNAIGQQVWETSVLAACEPRAIWSRPGDAIVVVSDPCDASGAMSVVALSPSGAQQSIQRLQIAPRVSSYQIRPNGSGRVIAAGMFHQDDGPNARKGWLFESDPISSSPP